MKTKLTIPQHEVNLAISLGATFDKNDKQWYIEDADDLVPFLRWMSFGLRKDNGLQKGTEVALSRTAIFLTLGQLTRRL